MDKISGFSDDELLVKILSFLPTEDAVRTSILSKQWKFLCMRLPKLDCNDTIVTSKLFDMRIKEYDRITESLLLEKCQSMRRFIHRKLSSHSSSVIESLCLRLFNREVFQPEDIKSWVEIAVSHVLQELSVNYFSFKVKRNAILPSSLYTCKSLVTLKLRGNIYVDVPHVFGLPSLKTLHLEVVTYADEESLQRLLSSSSVLEDLVLVQREGDNVGKFAVSIPSLLRLSLGICDPSSSDGYVINTPSLKYFKTLYSSTSSCLIVNMPKLEEADLTVGLSSNIKKFLEHIISVKRLSLCILDTSAEALYGDDIVFKELEHLNFRIFEAHWSTSLLWLLKASPKLRDLECHECFSHDGMDTLVCWKQLTSVPQCLLGSLQTFKWSGNPVSLEGIDLATYILRNSCQLKTATISTGQWLDPKTKLEMEKEVKNSFRGSPSCNLVFE